ncbi:hypothetical protein [Embleya scabrispora]|uniref:hypothetical protein n=1 Tax=Embleya scabrispora TaxID=159449 RepID=UPI0003717152|nr:hypothetical protein [Embleya scabrispora]MYS82648.1 hypothetical protein [Streptomyces sp. SID5474]
MSDAIERPVLRAAGSHLYPGALVRVHAPGTNDPHRAGTTPGDLLFADGSRTTAQVLVDPDERSTLWVGKYTTERGIAVSERVWSVQPSPDGSGDVLLRVGARLP